MPYSSYNLLDANLRKIIEQHENWKQERTVNYIEIKLCVIKTSNIQNVADELLDILLSMLVNKTKESAGYYEVLVSVLEVLRKLHQLPSNEGHRILFRFTSKDINSQIVNKMHEVLLEFLVDVSGQIKVIATANALPQTMNPAFFGDVHLRTMILLPLILNLAKDCLD